MPFIECIVFQATVLLMVPYETQKEDIVVSLLAFNRPIYKTLLDSPGDNRA